MGEKWEEVKRSFSYSFPWPPSIGTFFYSSFWPQNIGTFSFSFHWPLSIGIFSFSFHWPLNWDLLSPFPFSLKGWIQIIWSSISKHNFQLESWQDLFPQPSLVGEECLILVDGRKKESRLNVCSSFERKEVSRDRVGSLKS